VIFTAIAVKTSVFVHKGIVIFTKTYIITAIAVKNMDFSKGKPFRSTGEVSVRKGKGQIDESRPI